MFDPASTSGVLATAVFWLALGYLSGSIPFGLILARLKGLGDVRAQGSGNIGATNVLRLGGRTLAAATLLADALKGALPAAIALQSGTLYGATAGFAALAGHIAPVWLKFRGGKGVATYLGVLAALAWPAALMFCGAWLAVFAWRRISSLSALTAAIAAPLAVWSIAGAGLALFFAAMSAIVFITHRENIARLMAGTEPSSHIGHNE
jgi:glycerol-3-phosphate acyltransferase PlsY